MWLLDQIPDVIRSDTIQFALNMHMLTGLMNLILFFKKVNGYFLGSIMGIWHTHYVFSFRYRKCQGKAKEGYGKDSGKIEEGG